MSSDIIYDSIFDAFRVIAPCSPLLNLEKDTPEFFYRSNEYQLIDMGGYIGAYAGNPFGTLYRGEHKEYPNSKAIIYRGDSERIVIDKIRIIEFKNILQTFPQVQYALKDRANVDYLALAQHYELRTWLIDVTSAPEIAAYFATHQWINGVPTPVESGIGRIRGFMFPPTNYGNPDPKYHFIGLQCFERPGLQVAYGIEMEQDEDLGSRGWTVRFRQNPIASKRIHQIFHIDYKRLEELAAHNEVIDPSKHPELFTKNSWLMPDEEIALVANMIRDCAELSSAAVEEYLSPLTQEQKNDVLSILSKNSIEITDKPLFELSEERISELEKEYKDRPYGNVQLSARLSYKGLAN